VESFATSIIRSLTVVTRGLVVPSLGLVAPTRGLVVPSLGLVAQTRGLVIPSLRLVAPTRVVHGLSGHRLRARLALESLRVIACLELAPARRPRGAAVAAAIVGAGAWTTGPVVVAAAVAVVALAAVWHPIPGVRSSAIFVIVMTITVAVILAPPPVHLVTVVAVTAPAATRLTTKHLHGIAVASVGNRGTALGVNTNSGKKKNGKLSPGH
jgi:hypothetical protein